MPILPNNLSPVICMARDKKILSDCLDKISICEPCSVIGIEGNGMTIIYETLVSTIGKNGNSHTLKYINAQTEKELAEFALKLENDNSETLCVVNISTETDSSWFIQKLDDLRDARGVKFNTTIFSYLGEIYGSFEKKQKILFRSLFPLRLVNFKDSTLLMRDFERRFSYIPKDEQIKRIYELSGGHVGLIKSLYFTLRSNPYKRLNVGELLGEPSIKFRLDAIGKNLPMDFTKKILDIGNLIHKNDDHVDVFEKFGFWEDNKISSPLYHRFLKEKYSTNKLPKENLIMSFTENELRVYKLLQNKIGNVVSRDEIAKELWGNHMVERYSDWAIDQVVHRIREKIDVYKTRDMIQTKKGFGFILQAS